MGSRALASREKAQAEQEVARLLDFGFREPIEALRLEGSPYQIGRVFDRTAPELPRAQMSCPHGCVGSIEQAVVIATVVGVPHVRLLWAAVGCWSFAAAPLSGWTQPLRTLVAL
jgi:hypothetical protein